MLFIVRRSKSGEWIVYEVMVISEKDFLKFELLITELINKEWEVLGFATAAINDQGDLEYSALLRRLVRGTRNA